jgi:hypothetical protein
MSKGLTILSVVLLATAVGGANQAAADSLNSSMFQAGAAATPVVALNAVGPIHIGETASGNDVLDQARNVLQNNKKPAKPIKHHIEQRVVERSQESPDEHKLQILGIDSADALKLTM